MPISCEDCEEQMAILQTELALVNDLIADICAAFLVETDPMARMMLTMDLSAAYQAKAEIEYDIAIVTMNQIELGCIPPMAASVAAKSTELIAIHERMRKLQVARYVRKHKSN